MTDITYKYVGASILNCLKFLLQLEATREGYTLSKKTTHIINELIKPHKEIAELKASEIWPNRNKRETADHVNRLQKVAELSVSLTGDPLQVFERIAHMLAELLNVPVVCLSEIRGDELYFLSVYVNGEVMNHAGHCPLNITPCATVKKAKDMRIYDHVADKFPEASFLKTHNAFSYCGLPSIDRAGNVVAVTCLLDDKPHDFTDEDKNLLEIFGQRIGMEIEREKYVAERKKVEDALKESEHRYRTISELTTDYIYEISVDTKGQMAVKWISDGFTQLTGYTVDDVKYPEMWRNVIYPDDLPGLMQLFQAILLGQASNKEIRFIKKSGEMIWFNIFGRPVWDDHQNRIVGVIGAARDITEQKRMEDELRTLSLTDELTGLYNRRGFFTLTDHLLKTAKRQKKVYLCSMVI